MLVVCVLCISVMCVCVFPLGRGARGTGRHTRKGMDVTKLICMIRSSLQNQRTCSIKFPLCSCSHASSIGHLVARNQTLAPIIDCGWPICKFNSYI